MKRKSQDSCVTFKPNNYLKILLSSHTQTLQANIFSSGSESSKVHDLKMALWQVLALYSQTLTRKQLGLLSHAFLGKIPRREWVNYDLLRNQIINKLIKIHYLLTH